MISKICSHTKKGLSRKLTILLCSTSFKFDTKLKQIFEVHNSLIPGNINKTKKKGGHKLNTKKKINENIMYPFGD